MFRKSRFGLVFNTVFSLVFSLLITIFTKSLSHSLTPDSAVTGFLQGFAVNFTIGSFLNLPGIGRSFARIFIRNEKNPLFYLLQMAAIVFVVCTLMCFFMIFIETGFSSDFWKIYFSSLPAVFCFAYVAASLLFPFLLKLTSFLCSKDD